MTLILERDALAAAVSRVTRAVERRNTIPVRSNLALGIDPGRAPGLRITGTNLDMEITTTVPVTSGTLAPLTVPAHTLKDFVDKLPEGAPVSLEADDKGQRVVLKSRRSRITLPALPILDFPTFAAGDLPHRFDVSAETLLGLLDRVAFAISTEETRYYLNGIYLHVAEDDDGPMLRAVATDGHRLALAQVAAPEGTAGMPGIILPRKAVAEIAHLAKPRGKDEVTLAVSATKAVITAGATTLATKLVDGTFPDYGRVIPTGGPVEASLDAGELAAAIGRVMTVSSERNRAVKFAWEGTGLVLSASADSGEARDEMEVELAGGPVEIGFNGTYVLEMLRALPGKQAYWRMTDPGSPTLITAAGEPNARFVLMPMRV